VEVTSPPGAAHAARARAEGPVGERRRRGDEPSPWATPSFRLKSTKNIARLVCTSVRNGSQWQPMPVESDSVAPGWASMRRTMAAVGAPSPAAAKGSRRAAPPAAGRTTSSPSALSFVGEYIRGCLCSLKVWCPVSKLVNSDECPHDSLRGGCLQCHRTTATTNPPKIFGRILRCACVVLDTFLAGPFMSTILVYWDAHPR
jgi:hypothetical protein